ncbi:MFS transporter [Kineosporia succinea]|uniref:Na+/melibiose symporter-like transporter n=1 Tax=Kineosporia succinea TaxID=84632 RepID=A0ABT9PC23_9ACTN|nr:MFS transporter [Kineosporia succinea]MDP9830259.1 Na+/melibiose symporter-like transporter [Kineosporia succinea]
MHLGYGLGSVVTGTFGTVPGLMLLPYLTDSLGVSAVTAAVLVFTPKVWDVVLNPLAGRISDRSGDPRGPRRPFLLRGGIPLAAGFALLFAAPPLGSPALQAAWVFGLYLVCATAYAFFQVPYMSMPAEITRSYHERTRLMSWRVGVLAFVILLTGALAPAVRDAFGGLDGYRVMGALVGVLLLIGVVSTYLATGTAPVGPVAPAAGRLREQVAVAVRTPDFRFLLLTFVLQALASSTMLAAVAYVSRWVLDDDAAASVLFVCFIGPALLLTPVWAMLGRRFGKLRGYVAASLVWVVASGALLGAGSGSAALVYAAAGLAGIGYAGMQLFPMAMFPDVTAAETARTGQNRSGLFTGIWTAGETLGLALGPGLYGLVLACGGYRSSDAGSGLQTQPDSALTAIVIGFSLVPSLLVLASLIPLRKFGSVPARG